MGGTVSIRALLRHSGVVFGGGILLLLLLAAIFAPLLTSFDPIEIKPRLRLRPPSPEHLFGTDGAGRDIWTRVVYGARVSLFIGFAADPTSRAIHPSRPANSVVGRSTCAASLFSGKALHWLEILSH